MKSSAKKVKLASVNELFSTEEERRVEEVILRLPLSELHAYKGYPGLQGIMPRSQSYLVREDDLSLQELIESVKKRGIRTPGIVRPDVESGYEIIARVWKIICEYVILKLYFGIIYQGEVVGSNGRYTSKRWLNNRNIAKVIIQI